MAALPWMSRHTKMRTRMPPTGCIAGAEALGMSYHDYTLEILERGRYV
jgi:hypothetical protein